MIISLKNRFIFVANLKNASTSVEQALKPYSEIVVDMTSFGKHMALVDIEKRFSWIFKQVPHEDYFRFGVMRDPVDYFVSLYNFHRKEGFRSNPKLYTGDMEFDEFWEVWCAKHRSQTQPQYRRLLDAQGRMGVDFIINFDHLECQLQTVCGIMSLDGKHSLGKVNASEPYFNRADITQETWDKIYSSHGHDMMILRDYSGRKLSVQERSKSLECLDLPPESFDMPLAVEQVEQQQSDQEEGPMQQPVMVSPSVDGPSKEPWSWLTRVRGCLGQSRDMK